MSVKFDVFVNKDWLHLYGLNRKNVLNYFYTSQFYDSSSNNEAIRNDRIPNYASLLQKTGLEFELDNANIDEPHLYVIKKQIRRSPETVELLDCFYILDGSIYQSPELLELIRSKLWKTCSFLTESFRNVLTATEYTANGGAASLNWRKRKTIDDGDSGVMSTSATEASTRVAKSRAPAEQYIRECPSFEVIMADLSEATALVD